MVNDMNAMFQNALEFNQDISSWCVSNISSEPTGFSSGSQLTNANKPVWGTCPIRSLVLNSSWDSGDQSLSL